MGSHRKIKEVMVGGVEKVDLLCNVKFGFREGLNKWKRHVLLT